MLCHHPTLDNPHGATEMHLLKGGKHWFCRECGATLLAEDMPEYQASPGLVKELEAIIAERLERTD